MVLRTLRFAIAASAHLRGVLPLRLGRRFLPLSAGPRILPLGVPIVMAAAEPVEEALRRRRSLKSGERDDDAGDLKCEARSHGLLPARGRVHGLVRGEAGLVPFPGCVAPARENGG